MAGPYNPPNPYGSYFSFGQPEGAVGQTFGPMPYGTLSPSAMASMGVGSGGFNPTPMEYLSGQVRSQYQQRFMAEVLRNDPRAQTITTALLNQMSASAQKSTLNLFGGRANLQEMVGLAMTMPGVSSLVGGSPYSIAQGSLAAATGGMKIGGVGMFGDGAAGMLGAQQIVQHMTRQFYMQGGGANVAATAGLNRDQIGGIMMLGAAQGAFAGLNMGSFVQKGNQVSLNMDQGTMTKISQFTKTAAKALSSLIDIYGDSSVAELAAKANQITGLNFNQLGNAQVIQQRLASLRQTGVAMGVDTQTMFDMAAYANQMGGQMGLTGGFRGNVGVNAAIRGAEIFRSNQGQAGSFRTATTSLQEIIGGQVRDAAGMSLDPVGRRRMALQMAIETGHFTGSAADEARRLMREDGPGAMGRIDMFMSKGGISTDSYIKMMGGPQGMMQLMSDAGMDTVRELNADTVVARSRQVLRLQAVRAFGKRATGEGGTAMLGAIEGIGKETLDKIFQATKGGDTSGVEKMLQDDPAGRLNTDKYAKLIRSAVGQLGGEGAAAMHASLQQAISVNPFMRSHFMSESGRMGAATNRLAVMEFTEEQRGAMRQGAFEGLLAKMDGTDPRSNFVRASMIYKKDLIGVHGGIYIPKPGAELDKAKMQKTAHLLIAGLSGSDDGKEALRSLGLLGMNAAEMSDAQLSALGTKLSSPVEQLKAFGGRFQMAQAGENTMLISMKKLAYAAEWGDEMKIAKDLGDKVGGMTGMMLNRTAEIMRDNPERVDAAWKNLVNKTSDIAVLSSVDSSQLKKMAEASPMWADAMSEWLVTETKRLEKSGSSSQLKKAKELQDVFSEATGREKGGEGMVLTGQLELVGNALQLTAKMNQGKK